MTTGRVGHGAPDAMELASVQTDDALLDMLGAGSTPGDTDGELTRGLATWRLRELNSREAVR